jgi:glycosyltransferase involved in cell wall biosynthesis
MAKRILIGSSSPPDRGSGINAYVNQLVFELTRLGHQIIYAAPASQTAVVTGLVFEHLELGQQDSPVSATRKLMSVFASRKIDLIINNDNPYLQAIAPWSPCVFISVGHMGRTSVATLACFNHQWIDYVVAISGDMHKRFVQRFRLNPAKVPIVYNGVFNPYPAGLPAATPSNKMKLVFAGGSGVNKGADLLLKALEHPSWSAMDCELHWFGDINVSFRKRLNQYKNVVTHGRVSRVRFLEALGEADIFLLPSRTEGCPMAMLEAMSYGVIPLASDGKGAMQRLVIHGQEGYICRLSHWAQDMFDVLALLSGQRHRQRDDMRRKVFQRFVDDFTSTKTADVILGLSDSPVVCRSKLANKIQVLKWHRPVMANNKAPLINRIFIKTGYLAKSRKMGADELMIGKN